MEARESKAIEQQDEALLFQAHMGQINVVKVTSSLGKMAWGRRPMTLQSSACLETLQPRGLMSGGDQHFGS